MDASVAEITSRELPAVTAEVLARVRARAPRVHCITNAVAQNFTANMLLAVGAVPSMTIAPEEVGEFAASADALLVNLGTFDGERRAAARIAIEKVQDRRVPWVLDPVFADRSEARAAFAMALIARHPWVIRLNRAEFKALAGVELEGAALARFADHCGSGVGLTGETDIVLDRGRLACINNGHPMMARITALGCATSAVVAACLAVEPDAWRATAAGLIAIGVAGELAAAQAGGPASLAVGIVDTLYALDEQTLLAYAKVV